MLPRQSQGSSRARASRALDLAVASMAKGYLWFVCADLRASSRPPTQTKGDNHVQLKEGTVKLEKEETVTNYRDYQQYRNYLDQYDLDETGKATLHQDILRIAHEFIDRALRENF